MNSKNFGLVSVFLAGIVAAAAVLQFRPAEPLKAAVASGNENFTMVTVPYATPNQSEAVFVLNHLTGVLSGSVLDTRGGKFTHFYLRNVAADFQVASGTKSAQYAIVSSHANMASAGSNRPAEGAIYIAELSSGVVIAYAFPQPVSRNAGGPLELVKLDFFRFGESISQ
ncbi:MAG: hypothetical protein KDA85_01265 [Planctomycetaceae bacterium]|nr:hypothetical protein [Planctomycetaceae bacterium]